MKRLFSLAIMLAVAPAFAQTPTAAQVIDAAKVSAKKSGKNILVIFHASWCGWCHKLDDFLTKTDEGKLVGKGLEIVHLTVLESERHKADENAGGVDMMKAWGGEKAGLPFMAILDAKGKLVINSLMKKDEQGSNTGYPAAATEVAHFITMLEKGAKKISADERGKIGAWLTANAPK
ncbi:MAG: thioredoxin family protein [Chthonomonas sp.]|nr:thioredoxin family protein [Chthonomonas sp.]